MVHPGSRVYLLLSAMMLVVNITVFAMPDPDPHISIDITSHIQVKINPGIDGDGSDGSELELCQLLSQSRCHETQIKKYCPWTCRGSKLPTYNGPLDKIWNEDQCKPISKNLGPDWSVPDCQDQCNKETDCNGFIYNPDDGVCWTGQCPIPVPQPVDYFPPWVGYYIGNITAVTTEAPPTKAALTETPSTEAPSTEAPRTEAPSTEAPTTIEASETPTIEDPTSTKTTTTTAATTTITTACGGEFTSSSGMLHHPSNGGNYDNDEYCIWIIRTSHPITITFESFDLEQGPESGECCDYLYVRDGESSGSSLLGRFAGTSVPSPVQTTANGAYLLFTSDNSFVNTGFKILWNLTV